MGGGDTQLRTWFCEFQIFLSTGVPQDCGNIVVKNYTNVELFWTCCDNSYRGEKIYIKN